MQKSGHLHNSCIFIRCPLPFKDLLCILKDIQCMVPAMGCGSRKRPKLLLLASYCALRKEIPNIFSNHEKIIVVNHADPLLMDDNLTASCIVKHTAQQHWGIHSGQEIPACLAAPSIAYRTVSLTPKLLQDHPPFGQRRSFI